VRVADRGLREGILMSLMSKRGGRKRRRRNKGGGEMVATASAATQGHDVSAVVASAH